MQPYEKIYIGVYIYVDDTGNIKPLAIEWADGRRYTVDGITAVRSAPPKHVSGLLTVRYDCRIGGLMRTIYHEPKTNRWFVEKQML